MDTHVVYWYHLKEHIDPKCEGYIGITRNIEKRHSQHMRMSNSNMGHFYNAIKHYRKENIILTILHHSLTRDEAYALEEYYRPTKNIGWNYAAGGDNTKLLRSIRNKKVTLFYETNPDKEYTFDSITQAAEQLGLSIGRIAQAIKRKSNVYGMDGWHVVHENTNKTTIKSIRQIISERVKGTKQNKPNIWKGRTDRWSDAEKLRISLQHKGKTISQEQREIVRQKNRMFHPTCRSIKLVHKDNSSKEYSYHSISEASRELGIPLPRLKSKCQRKLSIYGKDGWAVIELGSQDVSSDHIEQ